MVEIPVSLKEFGEVSEDLVAVYTEVPEQLLEPISQEGLRIDRNRVSTYSETNQQVEQLLGREAARRGIEFDRTRSIFARPALPSDDDSCILELMVNPDTVLITDGEIYTAIFISLKNDDIEEARSHSRVYWEAAMTLTEYMVALETRRNSWIFVSPEVLIPFDIPVERIRFFDRQAEGMVSS